MSTFTDSMGDTWSVEFDGLLLDEIQQNTGIDLGDISAGGLAAIEQSPAKLVKVLTVICGDEIKGRGKTPREFAKRIVRDTITKASEAIVSAVGNFFPANQWSEIQSRLEQQRESNENWAAMAPLLDRLNQPNMPPAMREAVMAAIAEAAQERIAETPNATTSSQPSPMAEPSVIGQDDTPLTLASNVLENAGLTPAG